MPGIYSLQRQLTLMNSDIQGQNTKLERAVADYTQSMSAYMKLDKQAYTQKKFIIQQVELVFAAGLSFIPVVGPTVAATVSAMINAPTGTSALTSGLLAAVGYNAACASGVTSGANLNEWAKLSTAPVGTFKPSFSKPSFNSAAAVSLLEDTGTVGLISTGVGIVSSLLSHANPQLGKGAILIPVSKAVMEKLINGYGATLTEGMKWINTLGTDTERRKLLLLVFYNQVLEMKVGGRGNLLLETGLAREDNLETYKSLSDIQAALVVRAPSLNGKEQSSFKDKSRLKETVAKYQVATSYDVWFPSVVGDDAKNQLARHIISSICLDKAKTIAYVEDYKANMKGMFGDGFLIQIKKQGGLILPNQFTKDDSGHGLFSSIYGTYAKATGLDKDPSEHRKDYVMGVYAFHATLVHHLGTYNLSSLPPYGLNQENDIAVAKALIDAFATQWWITSRAYGSIHPSGSVLKMEAKHYTDNMIDTAHVLKLPYIWPYFNPDRVYKAQGYQTATIMVAAKLQNNIDINLNQNFEPTPQNLAGPIAQFKIPAASIANLELPAPLQRIENPFLLALMPTHKTGCTGFRDSIARQMSVLYSGIYEPPATYDPVALIITGFTEFNALQAKGYDANIGTTYDTAFGVEIQKNSASLKTQYRDILGVDEEALNNPANNDPKKKLATLLADLHMASLVGGKQPENFSQADFNRSVAKALKQIAILLPKH